MGVTIAKKITSITIGGTTLPRSAPSFIHKRLKGFSNTGLRNDKSNNIADKINQGSLIWLPSRTGHNEIIKNTTENTILKPKIKEVETLDGTTRGSGGFGSTGNK